MLVSNLPNTNLFIENDSIHLAFAFGAWILQVRPR